MHADNMIIKWPDIGYTNPCRMDFLRHKIKIYSIYVFANKFFVFFMQRLNLILYSDLGEGNKPLME